MEAISRFLFSCELLWRYALAPALRKTGHSIRRTGLLGTLLIGAVALVVLGLAYPDQIAGEAVTFFVTAALLIILALTVFFWNAAMEPIRLVRELERKLGEGRSRGGVRPPGAAQEDRLAHVGCRPYPREVIRGGS